MPEQFDTPVGLSATGGTWNFSIDTDGNLELRSNSPSGDGEPRMRFHDDTGQIFVGSADNPGTFEITSSLRIYDDSNNLRLLFSGEEQTIQLYNNSGEVTSSLDNQAALRLGCHDESGEIFLFPATATDPADETQSTIGIRANTADLFLGGNGRAGDFFVRDASERNAIHLSSSSAWLRVGVEGNEGDIEVQDGAGRRVIHMNGQNAVLRVGAQGNEGDIIVADASNRDVFHFDSNNAWLRVGANGNEGDIEVQDGAGRRVMHMDGQNAVLRVGGQGNEGDIIVADASNRDVFHFDSNNAWLRVGGSGNEGDIEVQDGAGRRVMHMDGNNAVLRVGGVGNEGDVIVRDDAGNETIHLNGSSGDIILRNADAAEDFTLEPNVQAEPGTVMVLADSGNIIPSHSPYDTRVVGVVAGAGNYRPGIVMDRREKSDGPRVPVSIMGKVTCRADATQGDIKVGDMLTTSSTAGTAMKTSDPMKAFGAVIGKALTPLAAGVGTIDMLISMR